VHTLHPTRKTGRRESCQRLGRSRWREEEKCDLTFDRWDDVARRNTSQGQKDWHLPEDVSNGPKRRGSCELIAVPDQG